MLETGGDRTKLQKYKNVEFKQLLGIDPNLTSPTLVLSVVPIAHLHTLLLNPCNHILKHLVAVWPELEEWLKSLHVVRDQYHGDKFEGKILLIFSC